MRKDWSLVATKVSVMHALQYITVNNPVAVTVQSQAQDVTNTTRIITADSTGGLAPRPSLLARAKRAQHHAS